MTGRTYISELQKQLEEQQKANTVRRVQREKVKDHEQAIPMLISEAVTRKLYIDVLLKEASWENLTQGRELEYEVYDGEIIINNVGDGNE